MNTEPTLVEADESAPEAGWYDDPVRTGWLRRWDGERWTTDTRAARPIPVRQDRRARLERLQMILALTALLLFMGVAVAIVVIGPARLHGTTPNADDVAAARSCATFRRFLDADPGRADPSHPTVVVRPRLAPRFSGLAADIDTAARAARDGDSSALMRAGEAVFTRCAALSPAAKAAGGFTR